MEDDRKKLKEVLTGALETSRHLRIALEALNAIATDRTMSGPIMVLSAKNALIKIGIQD